MLSFLRHYLLIGKGDFFRTFLEACQAGEAAGHSSIADPRAWESALFSEDLLEDHDPAGLQIRALAQKTGFQALDLNHYRFQRNASAYYQVESQHRDFHSVQFWTPRTFYSSQCLSLECKLSLLALEKVTLVIMENNEQKKNCGPLAHSMKGSSYLSIELLVPDKTLRLYGRNRSQSSKVMMQASDVAALLENGEGTCHLHLVHKQSKPELLDVFMKYESFDCLFPFNN